MSAPLLYPFTLGMLAAVNPCGFPLLPAYLELFVGGEVKTSPAAESEGATDLRGRAGRAVVAGAFCTVGFLVLFGLLGLLVDLGWSTVSDHSASLARYAMVAGGVGMVVLGGAGLLRLPLRLHLPEIRGGLGLRRPAALTIFGLSYGIASIGCALPLFVAGVATSFTHDSAVQGSADLVAYALGMGSVLTGLALAMAIGGRSAARPLRRVSRFVPTVGSALLVVIGLYLTGYWLTAIVNPSSASPAEHWVTGLQQHLANVITGHAVLIGSILAAAVVGAILALALPDRETSIGTAIGSGIPSTNRTHRAQETDPV